MRLRPWPHVSRARLQRLCSLVDSVTRFDDRAADYVRYRPTYPPAAIDAILEALGPASSLIAADIGAGTGISARLLGDRGARVIAIEPGADMRGAAAPHAKVVWLAARAEATALASGAVDLIVCAQAFHWFQSDETIAELARILRPGGRVVLMWNRRSRIDPLTVGYRQAILDVGGDTGVESMRFDPAIVSRTGLFSPVERIAVPNLQRLDLDGLVGRARSASYVPKSGEAGERLRELLRVLHDRHADADGFVTLVHETEVYRARKL